MTAVLVVEDQHALASALEVAIGAQPDLECLGSAGTVDDALEQVARQVPDVVLMDIQLPGGSGIECTRLIKASHPEVTVLILTADASATRLAQAAAAGATGFLTKGSSFADILTAIRNPAGAKMVIEGTTLWALIDALREGEPGPSEPAAVPAQAGGGQDWARLTVREQEVLALMGEGLDPKAIAERLVVSLHTARGHVKSVMTKLGAHSQLEAVVVATRSGLIPHDGSASAHLCPLIRWLPTIWGVGSDHLRVAVSAGPAIAWMVCATHTRTRRFLGNRAGHRVGGTRKFPVSRGNSRSGGPGNTACDLHVDGSPVGSVRVIRGYARTLVYLIGIYRPRWLPSAFRPHPAAANASSSSSDCSSALARARRPDASAPSGGNRAHPQRGHGGTALAGETARATFRARLARHR